MVWLLANEKGPRGAIPLGSSTLFLFYQVEKNEMHGAGISPPEFPKTEHRFASCLSPGDVSPFGLIHKASVFSCETGFWVYTVPRPSNENLPARQKKREELYPCPVKLADSMPSKACEV